MTQNFDSQLRRAHAQTTPAAGSERLAMIVICSVVVLGAIYFISLYVLTTG
jgi:hypothetical protein